MDSPLTESRLKQVLEELHQGCGKYVTITQTSLAGPGTGKTKLDKEHVKLCLREIVSELNVILDDLFYTACTLNSTDYLLSDFKIENQ